MLLRRLLLAGFLAAVVLLGGYLLVVFAWSYSSGDRVGWVQKISRKGWVCKTWEGELLMSALPGSIPEKFAFTVPRDEVAARINDSEGRHVRLHYEQHRGLPGSCFGETGYWVDEVTVLSDSPPLAPAPAGGPTPGAARP